MEELKDYREVVLNNGMKVAWQPSGNKTVSGRLVVKSGAARDGDLDGIAHFVEHCIDDGETKDYSSDEVREIKKRFGWTNAGTNAFLTQYEGEFLPEELERWLDITSSTVLRPRFNQELVEQERARILRETIDYWSKPGKIDGQNFGRMFFGEKNPASVSALGKPETVRKISRQDLFEFHSRNYTGGNIELILTGDINGRDVGDLARKHFGSAPAGQDLYVGHPVPESADRRVVFMVPARDLYNQEHPSESNAHFTLVKVVPSQKDEDFARLIALVDVLGCGSNSRLFRRISQERGLAYNISGEYEGNSGYGLIIVEGSVLASRLEEALDLTFEEFKRLKREPPFESEVEDRKRKTEFFIAKRYECNESRMEMIWNYLRAGITPDEVYSRIKAIKPEDILETARKYLPSTREDNYGLFARTPSLD